MSRFLWLQFAMIGVQLVSTGCGGPLAPDTEVVDPVIGVKIYETDWEHRELFDEWRVLGINTVFASADLASSDRFRALANETGTKLFVIFPVFYAPEELAGDPDLWAVTAEGERAREDWVEFACPSRTEFRQKRVEEARAVVERLRPDGLSIDFIRHFVFWEMVGPDQGSHTLPDTCYCSRCLEGFTTFVGVPSGSIPSDPPSAASWIEANAGEQWVRFKTGAITLMAAEIVDAVRDVDPDIAINLHIVPWRRSDYDGALLRVAAQDLPALGEISDFLSPMTYSFMLHRNPEWVASVVQDLDAAADCPVLPSIQVSPAYREGDVFSSVEFEAVLRAALLPPSAGVVFWSWDHIEADPEKAAVIRRIMGDHH